MSSDKELPNNKVTQFEDIWGGDARLDTLYEALWGVIDERAAGKLAKSSVIGVLEIIKNDLANS